MGDESQLGSSRSSVRASPLASSNLTPLKMFSFTFSAIRRSSWVRVRLDPLGFLLMLWRHRFQVPFRSPGKKSWTKAVFLNVEMENNFKDLWRPHLEKHFDLLLQQILAIEATNSWTSVALIVWKLQEIVNNSKKNCKYKQKACLFRFIELFIGILWPETFSISCLMN